MYPRGFARTLKSLLKKELCTLLFFLLNTGALVGWHLCIGSGAENNYSVVRKIISIVFHVVPIVTVTFLYLMKKIENQLFTWLLGISRGYLLYDIPMMYLFPGMEDSVWSNILYTLHHIVFFTITYFSSKYAKYIAMGLLSEISNIPLNYVLVFQDDVVVSNTLLFKLMCIALLLSYFLFRVVNFCVLEVWMMQKYRRGKATMLEAVLLLPLCCMNFYWFFRLIEGAIKKLS